MHRGIMAAICVRQVVCHGIKMLKSGGPGIPGLRICNRAEKSSIFANPWRWYPFCTEAVDSNPSPAVKRKKQDPRARDTITSVGRKISARQIQVISEAGEDMGVLHRADVLRIMDEKGLKLVLLSEQKDPPVYRLMSGKQIHEEQMKMGEKQKTKAAPLQVKELTFSSGIAPHDLKTKFKQVERWLEKKHHVRITLRSPSRESINNLDENLEQIVQQMEVMVGYVSKPRVIREGKAAMCILRPPSAKELSRRDKDQTSQSQSTGRQAAKDETSLPDTKEDLSTMINEK
ncbi:translation initiation factor IF-3, mitochondrial isoform X2 [Corythoichthys intestinalis]|uniref:translation initiation factor IF-3, mitochondrial isoform X2 n=1 Tax=Corythoichthys intestinalis TaxID=161448 RepID=UPI0025A633A5|nr:translation initiation factor IF-3, mitochondrial isoform X2 [Corythoichthys intestinalis]